MKILKKFILILMSMVLAFAFAACNETPDTPADSDEQQKGNSAEAQAAINTALAALGDEEFTRSQLMGVDNLGREITPLVGLNDKYVGLFYFVATGYTGDQGGLHSEIYDLSKLLEKYPLEEYPLETSPIVALSSDRVNYKDDEAPEGKSYFWGKPLYDYYRSDDEWVVRKHLELFMNAGIDFLYLDFTNDIVYPEATKTLLKVIKEMQEEGYTPPLLTAFLCATSASRCAFGLDRMVNCFFQTDEYDSCWFRGDTEMNPSQKPLIIGNFANIAQNSPLRTRFCLTDEQWPGEQFNKNAIPWMDHNYPQKNHNGVMNVSVSQGGSASSEAFYNKKLPYKARGYDLRNYSAHGYEEDKVMSGTNFDWQWKTVHDNADDIKMVTITGWNEWIVTKLPDTDVAAASSGRASFIDSFNMAYSRDAEMMEGGYGDNYYMQMVQNIRKFKGETVEDSDNVYKGEKKTVSDLGDASAWTNSRKYLDLGLATVERDWTLVDRSQAVKDDSNRNDIEYVQFESDANNLYVAVTCRDDITTREDGDTNWMNLYLSCGGKGWEGYDFLVGREHSGATASIEALSADGAATAAGSCTFALCGTKTVVYAIPLSALGVKENSVIGVKAADNLKKICDADEFMLHGDCAPMGRLNYAYKIA